MVHYRIAGRLRGAPDLAWRWRTTRLDSLPAVWISLQKYRWPEHTQLRLFSASSVECLEEMLARANAGKSSTSVAAERVVSGRLLPALEWGAGGGIDEAVETNSLGSDAVAETERFGAGLAGLDLLHARRLELEIGPGGDHDVPYLFALPDSWPEAVAWIHLMTNTRAGA
jgi:hypothetical protein